MAVSWAFFVSTQLDKHKGFILRFLLFESEGDGLMKEQLNWKVEHFKDYPLVKKLSLYRTGHRWKKEWIYTDEKRRRYYHKDPLHGEVEVYDKNGKHITVMTPEGTPHPIKGKVKGREIPI